MRECLLLEHEVFLWGPFQLCLIVAKGPLFVCSQFPPILREGVWTGTVTRLNPKEVVVFFVFSFFSSIKVNSSSPGCETALFQSQKPQVDYVKVCTSSSHLSEAQEAFWWHQHEKFQLLSLHTLVPLKPKHSVNTDFRFLLPLKTNSSWNEQYLLRLSSLRHKTG